MRAVASVDDHDPVITYLRREREVIAIQHRERGGSDPLITRAALAVDHDVLHSGLLDQLNACTAVRRVTAPDHGRPTRGQRERERPHRTARATAARLSTISTG